MSHRIVLGVDGGATKTLCLALDRDRRVLGEGRAGASNRNSVGDGAARANLAAAIAGALGEAGRTAEDVDAICVGMAGVDRPAERAAVATWLAELLPGALAEIENDALIALAGASDGDLFGVVVVSGTGMIVYGVNRAGERRRAGGWGALIDLHGSGYAMGVAALRAMARAADGIDAPTLLTGAILRHLQLTEIGQLIPWVYVDLTWARFAELAPVVVMCADSGDVAAQSIVNQTAHGLAEAVAPVVRGLGLSDEPFPLVLAGGNLRPGPVYAQLTEQIRLAWPQADIVAAGPPALGAALRASYLRQARQLRL
jgi:N-acetylglucosamine kinase-like BadF-type ATPase